MVPAWYMRFVPGHHGAADRVGGRPSHLPPEFPVSSEGQPLRFLAQFECAGQRLAVPGARYLQLYQDDPEQGPLPVVVLVPDGAAVNLAGTGEPQPGVKLYDIAWERRNDPPEVIDDDVELTASKAGGSCYFLDALLPGERLLLQLRQLPAEINFGGYTMVIAVNNAGQLRVTLG